MSTLLPLETFRRIVHYHPFHFFGLADSDNAPVSQCNDIIAKYGWQASDAAGRDDILQAIETAESKLKDYLRWSVAPHWVDEVLPFPQFHQVGNRYTANAAVDGRWMTVNATEGKIQAVGQETLTLIGTATITYSDADGDGLSDTFTATTVATTTETDSDDIDVYFGSADRLDNESANDNWKIAPVQKTINGNGTVTVRGRAWLLVKPILYEGLAATQGSPIDPTVAANFVTSVEVYRHYTNPDGTTVDTSQAVLIWETAAYPNFAQCCGGTVVSLTNTTDPASYYQAVARAGIRNAETGELNPAAASYDATNAVWSAVTWGLCVPPDRVRTRYKAGQPLVRGEMTRQLQTIVARLACAELVVRPTACDVANREFYRWQFDLARAAGNNDEQYRISNQDLNNPLGTRAGQVQAWKYVLDQAHVTSFVV